MKLTYTPEQEAFRAEVRAWMKANVPKETLASHDTVEGFTPHWEWEKTLAKGQWGMVTWPKEYGGRGCDLIQWLIFEEEYYRAQAPGRVNQNGIFLLGPTLMEFGSPEQKARFLPAMAAGDEIWAQAWSEPQAGSDLAALRSTATRDGDEYVLRGHKIWSSRAVFAHWCFGMFRTDPKSEKHRGISFILVPLNTPGIRVNGIRQIDGEAGFAEIFFEDARVPVANRLGEEGDGWKIAMATAGFERGMMLRSPARFQVTAERLVELYKKVADKLDPGLRSQVAQMWMDAQSFAMSTYMMASRLINGGHIGVEASLTKIFWSEMDVNMHRIALQMLGVRAELLHAAPDAGDIGSWLDGYIFSLAGPIYAGTNEIQRNIIAERLLGLPRG